MEDESEKPDDQPPSKRSRRKWMFLAAGGFVSAGIVTARLFLIGKDASEKRLRGTWISDGDRTVREWKQNRGLNEEQVAKLRSLFGKLRMTWGENTYATELEGQRNEGSYLVIDANEHLAVLRTKSAISGNDEEIQVNFENAGTYWVNVMGGPMKEYFNRVD